VDQLFDSGKIKVARVVLLSTNFGKDGRPKTAVSRISQETLAGMAGTTGAQVRLFMDRFRESDFVVQGRSGLQIHSSLPVVFVRELPRPNPAGKDRRQR
jgi:hypothetical protein